MSSTLKSALLKLGILTILTILSPFIRSSEKSQLSAKQVMESIPRSLEYRFKLEAQGQAAPSSVWGDTKTQAAKITQSLEGGLRVLLSQGTYCDGLLGISLENLSGSLSVDGIAQSQPYDQVVEAMVKNCAVAEIRFESGITPDARIQLKGLFSQIQFALDDHDQGSWEAEEEDLEGVQYSRYEKLSDQSQIKVFKKTTSNYKAKNSQGVLKIVKEGSSSIHVLKTNGIIENIQATLTSAHYMGKKVVGKTSSNLDLHLIKELRGESLVQRTRNGNLGLEPHFSPIQAAIELDLLRRASLEEQLKGATVKSIIAEIDEVIEFNSKKFTQTSSNLAAILKLDPKSSYKFANLLKNYKRGSLAFDLITSNLGYVGHPDAQLALIDAMHQHSQDPDKLAHLIPHLSLCKNPIPESVEELRSIAEHSDAFVRSTGTLGLANIGNTLIEQNKPESLKILDTLAMRLKKTREVSEVTLTLDALGNLGLDEQWNLVKPFLGSKNRQVQHSAIKALRFMKSEEARESLLTIAHSDPIEQHRAEAVRGLGESRDLASMLAFHKALLGQEKSKGVVMELLTNIGRLANDLNEAKVVLEEFRAQTGNSELYSMVTDILRAIGS